MSFSSARNFNLSQKSNEFQFLVKLMGKIGLKSLQAIKQGKELTGQGA